MQKLAIKLAICEPRDQQWRVYLCKPNIRSESYFNVSEAVRRLRSANCSLSLILSKFIILYYGNLSVVVNGIKRGGDRGEPRETPVKQR